MKKQSPLEKDVLRSVLQWLEWKGIMAWRTNNVGIFNAKTGGYFFHGKKGIADIIGILPQTVTLQDGTSATFGNLLAIETKREGKQPSEEQAAFLKSVNDSGGLGICVHSLEELEEFLKDYI